MSVKMFNSLSILAHHNEIVDEIILEDIGKDSISLYESRKLHLEIL